MSKVMRIGGAGAGLIGRRQLELIAASPNDAHRTLAVVEAVEQAARSGERISPSQLVEQAS